MTFPWFFQSLVFLRRYVAVNPYDLLPCALCHLSTANLSHPLKGVNLQAFWSPWTYSFSFNRKLVVALCTGLWFCYPLAENQSVQKTCKTL